MEWRKMTSVITQSQRGKMPKGIWKEDCNPKRERGIERQSKKGRGNRKERREGEKEEEGRIKKEEGGGDEEEKKRSSSSSSSSSNNNNNNSSTSRSFEPDWGRERQRQRDNSPKRTMVDESRRGTVRAETNKPPVSEPGENYGVLGWFKVTHFSRPLGPSPAVTTAVWSTSLVPSKLLLVHDTPYSVVDYGVAWY
ncbi:hypothetical protein BP00DRAFT_259157 [Aspergillus indologenus CBS 114.80]|uniref:Uncharacterized protein n=1 Tax=Aspergillus indologenus CBS 114.80 TaxID=1450541 RepID=A0A2V5HVG8_9EURO|nr:hypothetical protein BP00DRAFT_259157 [Aspergillus indologenus CBS 114.80]